MEFVQESNVLSLFVFSLTIVSCVVGAPSTVPNKFPPVILVPGDGGSQYEATLDKPSVVHRWCTRKTEDWFALWLNLEMLAPFALDCFVDNIRLEYNNKTRTTTNSPGVSIRQPGFGNTSTVEWLDESQLGYTSYFYHIVDFLTKNLSYVRNQTIRGAPYDFRKAPNEMSDFIHDLQRLIVDTFEANNHQPVVLIAHSMGNLYVQYLLSNKPQQWKDKYIKAFVTLGGPWGGAVKSIRLMTSGDNLGVFVVNTLKARTEQRSMPSTAWLMPYDTFWNDSEVLVYGPYANYTVKDYKQLFHDINYPIGYLMREDTEPFTTKLEAPGVEVHCLHGIGVDTPAAFTYTKEQWYDIQPGVIYGDGDGTVNLPSLLGCLRWVDQQKAKVYHQPFQGAEHLQMLKNADVIQYIVKVLKT